MRVSTDSGALAANPADAYVGTDPGLKIRFEVNRGWDRGHCLVEISRTLRHSDWPHLTAEKAHHRKWLLAWDCLGRRRATRETTMSLTAEQCRALALLTGVGLNGASQASLMARGFCTSMIAGLVKRGLATLAREKIRAGSRSVDVTKVRITTAGREALTAEGLALYPRFSQTTERARESRSPQ